MRSYEEVGFLDTKVLVVDLISQEKSRTNNDLDFGKCYYIYRDLFIFNV